MKSGLDKPFCTLDTETSGLSPDTHEIVEIAIVDDTGTLYHSLVKPQFPDRMSPEAARVSGYNEKDWCDAPFFEEIADELNRVLKGKLIVGQNVKFDLDFLQSEMRRANKYKRGCIDRRSIDTITLAIEHLQPLGLRRANLDEVCFFLGLTPLLKRSDPNGRHSALNDAIATHAVFRKLWRPNPSVLAMHGVDYQKSLV